MLLEPLNADSLHGLGGDSSAAESRLSLIDRFLPLWIVLAMAVGVGLGRLVPDLGSQLDRVKVAGVSLPIAIGLLWMMYPVLAKVRYGSLGQLRGEGKLFGLSMLLNWVIGPMLMFALAWLFLPDLPAYRNGLILIGLARCIAMVLIWNQLACGDGEIAAVLVAINSVFQIVMYSVLGWLFLTAIPGWFGASTTNLDVSMGDIALSVAIFLGIPLLAGALTRLLLVRSRGEGWYGGGVPASDRSHGPAGLALHDRADVRDAGRPHPRCATRCPADCHPACRLFLRHVQLGLRTGLETGLPI
jgi:ACR3 family arsenite transporter